jgi:hypothetical protein
MGEQAMTKQKPMGIQCADANKRLNEMFGKTNIQLLDTMLTVAENRPIVDLVLLEDALGIADTDISLKEYVRKNKGEEAVKYIETLL